MEFSTALTKVGAMGMDIMALFTELGSAITVCFDQGATAGEKFVAVLSTIPAAAMTIADIIGGLADMPKALEVLQKGFEKLPILIGGAGTTIGGFFASISGKAIAATAGIEGLGAVFAGLSATLGPVGAGIAIVAAALVALFGLFKLGESIYNNWAAKDPGK
jgi:phage-related minor tail protein